jgi:hypothetical protein
VSGDSTNVTAGNEAQTPAESPEELERRLQEEDKKAVEDEIAKWEKDGVIRDDDPEMEDFDLLRFWQVRKLTICLNCLLMNFRRAIRRCTRYFGDSRPTPFQCRHQQFHVSAPFHPAKRQMHFGGHLCHRS